MFKYVLKNTIFIKKIQKGGINNLQLKHFKAHLRVFTLKLGINTLNIRFGNRVNSAKKKKNSV